MSSSNKKRILIVTRAVGNTASGIVAEQWISGFIDNDFEVAVACNKVVDRSPQYDCFSLEESKKLSQMDKVKYILFNSDVRWGKWRERFISNYINELKQFSPDIIWVMASGQSDNIPKLGYELAEKLRMPYHIHTVDAIPSPEGWGVLPPLRRAVGKSVQKIFRKAHSFSATNLGMTEYLRKYHRLRNNKSCFTLYNPIDESFIEGNETQDYALYLGNLNSRRNGEHLFKAINTLEKEGCELKFIFAGTNEEIIKSHFKQGEMSKNIERIAPVNPPDELIRKAKLLIDVDIETEGDVYMSSKLNRYLNSDIPVLNITTHGSPAFHLLSKFDGCQILTVRHDVDRIKKAILKLSKVEGFETEERRIFANRFIIKNQMNKLLNRLNGH